MALAVPAAIAGINPGVATAADKPGAAFARYVESTQSPSAFDGTGVALEIEGSLPGLDKQCHVLLIRIRESNHDEYVPVEIKGDSVVMEKLIAPYLADSLGEPGLLAPAAITPENYKFHFAGAVGAEGSAAYIFHIAPRKGRKAVTKGELWIDPTGNPVLVSGRVDRLHIRPDSAPDAPKIRSINVTRELALADGQPAIRTTHITLELRPAGRAELTIVECPLSPEHEDDTPAEPDNLLISAIHAFPAPPLEALKPRIPARAASTE